MLVSKSYLLGYGWNMAGETANIAASAEILADEIFSHFFWERKSLKNENTDCCDKEEHIKKNHPNDAVFYYEDPYSNEVIHLLTDLKSYGGTTLESHSTAKYEKLFKSLAMSMSCAELSEQWKTLFAKPACNVSVHGMLFVYNHDGDYSKDVADDVKDVDLRKVSIPKGRRIYLLGNMELLKLGSIVNDMNSLKVKGKLSNERENHTFLAPDKVLSKQHHGEWGQAASIESLLSDFLVVRFRKAKNSDDGYVVYYSGVGDSVDEFIYLLDWFSHYRILTENCSVRIRLVGCDENAASKFESAKILYNSYWNDEKRRENLDAINISSVQIVTAKFNLKEIGMDYVE